MFESRKMLELNKKAMEKNLKVGVGLMCRHSQAHLELVERIRNDVEHLVDDPDAMATPSRSQVFRSSATVALALRLRRSTDSRRHRPWR